MMIYIDCRSQRSVVRRSSLPVAPAAAQPPRGGPRPHIYIYIYIYISARAPPACELHELHPLLPSGPLFSLQCLSRRCVPKRNVRQSSPHKLSSIHTSAAFHPTTDYVRSRTIGAVGVMYMYYSLAVSSQSQQLTLVESYRHALRGLRRIHVACVLLPHR
jgi:hypothetical protein